MISLHTLFWVMVIFFALIGFLRGWTKEIIALAGLILSLFALRQFGWPLIRLLGASPSDPLVAANPNLIMRQQFYVLAIIHLVMAFFSYQGAPLASQVSGGRFGVRIRAGLQDRLLGGIVGAINGYLIVGALWSFLEFQLTADGLTRLPPGFPYPFEPAVTRPSIITPTAELIMTHLPLPFLAPYLPILVVLVFIFVIVVII